MREQEQEVNTSRQELMVDTITTEEPTDMARPGTMMDTPMGLPETRNQALQQWEVNIRFLSVGCVISVGCRTIGFGDVNEAMRELTKYVSNPIEEREKWNKIFNS